MDMSLPIQHGMVYGLILSAMMTAFLLVIGLVNPEIMLSDYPPDIRAKHGPISKKAQRQKRLFDILFALLLIGLVVVAILQLAQAIGGAPTFIGIFVMLFVMFMVFNLVDLLILDWLIFVTIQPKFVVLPGTAGMAGYRDYGFHFRGFLKGTVIILIASLVIAGIASLIFAFT